MEKFLKDDFTKNSWIEDLRRKVCLRKNAIKELVNWFNFLENDTNEIIVGRTSIVQLIKYIDCVIGRCKS